MGLFPKGAMLIAVLFLSLIKSLQQIINFKWVRRSAVQRNVRCDNLFVGYNANVLELWFKTWETVNSNDLRWRYYFANLCREIAVEAK